MQNSCESFGHWPKCWNPLRWHLLIVYCIPMQVFGPCQTTHYMERVWEAGKDFKAHDYDMPYRKYVPARVMVYSNVKHLRWPADILLAEAFTKAHISLTFIINATPSPDDNHSTSIKKNNPVEFYENIRKGSCDIYKTQPFRRFPAVSFWCTLGTT